MPPEILRLAGQSKSSQLSQILLDQIIQEEVQPGEKLWTESELIQKYGVSVATVRKVLDDLSRQGITERRVAKGTFLKSFPKLERKTSQPVVMLSFMPHASLAKDLYFGPIVHSIEQTFHAAGQRFYLMSGKWGTFPAEELADIRNADPAAIILPYGEAAQKTLIAQLVTLGVPLILLSSTLAGAPGTQIHFDDYSGGVMAAEYLLEKGHRRFGIIGAPNGSIAGEQRVQAFTHTILRAPDAEIVHDLTPGGYDELFGSEQAEVLLKEGHNEIDALFCAGDLLAHGAMAALSTSGIRVPEDIAVMGYGDFDIPIKTRDRLSTIHMDLPLMGQTAAEAVLSLNDEATSSAQQKVIRIPVSLIAGQTA